MPLVSYVEWKPSGSSLEIIDQAVEILEEYAADGYDLSLRQLYYQFVSRDLLSNTQKSYARLGDIISKARDAGLIDWDHISDRGRSLYGYNHYSSGEEFLRTVANQFHLDLWEGQPVKCQVWVEKDALSGVVARAANAFDVPYFPNKGYVSASSIWEVSQGILEDPCEEWVVLHLGDHDPSGIDMSRDIQERLDRYTSPYREWHQEKIVTVKRIALNMDQVEEYGPPPNPAKTTDSRFEFYLQQFGDESWELDALEPSVIVELIKREIRTLMHDEALFLSRLGQQEKTRRALRRVEL